MSWPRPRLSGRMLAVAIVALALGGAVAGAATGARVAAEAAPPADIVLPAEPAAPSPERPVPAQLHRVLGRVTAARGEFIRVRTPKGEVVRVHVLPRAVVRRAGQRVSLDAVERFDRVLAVGRVTPNGVLQARAVLVQPTPLSRPWPAAGAPAPNGDQPPGADAP
ncbi:MAG TPA: hypothetical protein VFE37_22655 [Chloroflexota bacterium]|nr:hypothetical protein [Chloroflexota bacterium]